MTTTTRPYRGRSPHERREERRQRLLAAGREGFVAGTDARLEVGEVCRRAGVSKRHFYELYDDRLDLVRALHAEAVEWFRQGFDDDTHPTDPVAWIASVVPSLFARLLEDPARGHVLALAPVRVQGASPTVADIVVEGLVRRVGLRDGGPATSQERVRRHALGAVAAGRTVLAEWLLAEDGPARGCVMTQYVEDVVSVVTSALAPVLP